MRNRLAFTLVEVMISVLIGTVILEAIYTMVLIGQKSWNNYSNNLLPKEELRKAVSWMTSELREAQSLKITQDARKAELDFERPLVGKVSYTWNSSGDNANQVIRITRNQKRILAKEVTSLSFKEYEDNGIAVYLKGGRNQELSLNENIALRSQTGLLLQGKNEAVK